MSLPEAQQPICVVGEGAWATALANLLANNGQRVHWVLRLPEHADYAATYCRNPVYLKELALNEQTLWPTSDLAEALEASGSLLVAVPAAFVDQWLRVLPKEALRNKPVLSAVKGLEANSGQLLSGYLAERWGVPAEHYCAVLGPAHAEEVSQGYTTILTVAGTSPRHTGFWAEQLRSRTIRTVTTPDVQGAEYGAVFKNVYAIAAGLAAGLHYGDNFLAALVAAALGELDHFLQAQVAGERQITDSVYAGDLMVTAFSTHSRNRRLGYLLGQGETLETIFQTYHLVPEGYYAVRLLVEQHNVQQPIVRGVYELLYQQAEPAEVFERLLGTLR